MRQNSFQKFRSDLGFFTTSNRPLLFSPEALNVSDAALHFFGRKAGAHFEDFDVVWTHKWFKRSEVDHAGAGGAVVATGELHVVDVEAGEMFGHRLQVHGMIYKP